MVSRDELINTIHTLLGLQLCAQAQQIDTNANGVQVHGAPEVTKIALGVSASLDFLTEAVRTQAQFCLVHHGLPLSLKHSSNARLTQSQQALLKYVFAHNLTVAGYHYTLDAQPEFGNNATLIKLLGAKRLDLPYFATWGWVGEFAKPQKVQTLAQKLSKITHHDVFAVYGGPELVKRIGVCSGGGRPSGAELHEIFDLGVDLHITGEISESGPATAYAAGFNYFSAGHYATEVFGVQELGKRLKAHYKNRLQVEFIDIPNPL